MLLAKTLPTQPLFLQQVQQSTTIDLEQQRPAMIASLILRPHNKPIKLDQD
jgi:hypothetical protein